MAIRLDLEAACCFHRRVKLLFCLPALLWAATTPFASAGSATWSTNPVSGDWNTASNWMPNTVPNSMTDVATFDASNLTTVSVPSTIAVGSIIFTPNAGTYTISTMGAIYLVLWNEGVINNSPARQTIDIPTTGLFENGRLTFRDSATAGDNVVYNVSGGYLTFLETSSAGSATFYITGDDANFSQGDIFFSGKVTAATSTINVSGDAYADFFNGATMGNATLNLSQFAFADLIEASAGHATINLFGEAAANTGAGSFGVGEFSNASAAVFNVYPATGTGVTGGVLGIGGDADDAMITVYGSAGAGGAGSAVFGQHSQADSCTVVAHGGMSGGHGGSVSFTSTAEGDLARLVLDGNAVLDITGMTRPLTVGSVEGSGTILLGVNQLNVGANDLSTQLDAIISGGDARHGGALGKVGVGMLTLTGANVYLGATRVTNGVLRVSNLTGSATGSGAVQVDSGTLGGKGIIAGPVTIGTGSGRGAVLRPSVGLSQTAKFTMQSALTFNADSTYTCKLRTQQAKADQVVANGVTITSGAQFNFLALANKRIASGMVFTLLSNTSATPISAPSPICPMAPPSPPAATSSS